MTEAQPIIQVGIMAGETIGFELTGNYKLNDELTESYFQAVVEGKEIKLKSKERPLRSGKEFVFQASSDEDSFLLENVTIGIDFHWEQKENQRFRGDLKLIIEKGKVCAVNIIPLEKYLGSVISSEMSATSSFELLKAHAVISRSWLIAQIEKSKQLKSVIKQFQSTKQNENELIRWHDREDHELFDVCSDDHCQRYQGISKMISHKASQAVENTEGEVLLANNVICDARFSKCCGGVTENFENVWEPNYHSYLVSIIDSSKKSKNLPDDLRQEDEAEEWIRNNPPAFCNTSDKKILSQVLPDFDQATADFYRWKVSYTQEELSTLLLKKTGIDFGMIVRLEPVERGHSSRLIKLKIVGTKETRTIGKELEIRRALSPSHLYSSAFVIDHLEPKGSIPQKFVLTGAGWGHGVGLCQIGAAMMSEKGYSYKDILAHYFQGVELKKIY